MATLLVTDDGGNSPQVVTLAGSTDAETLTILPQNGGSLVQVVAAGQTATFKLQIVANFSGTVSFPPCFGAPANATCSTDSTSLPFTANPPTNFSINVATVAGSSSPSLVRKLFKLQISADKIVLLASLAFYALLFRIIRTRTALRGRASNSNYLALRPFSFSSGGPIVALLALSFLAIAGCGGASHRRYGPCHHTNANLCVSNLQNHDHSQRNDIQRFRRFSPPADPANADRRLAAAQSSQSATLSKQRHKKMGGSQHSAPAQSHLINKTRAISPPRCPSPPKSGTPPVHRHPTPARTRPAPPSRRPAAHSHFPLSHPAPAPS